MWVECFGTHGRDRGAVLVIVGRRRTIQRRQDVSNAKIGSGCQIVGV